MSAICLLGDKCTGHGGYPPRKNLGSDSYLTVNGRPVHCVGHKWEKHCDDSCHDGVLAAGSGYLSVNGLAVGRIGDPISCGGTVATGDDYLSVRD